MKWSIYIYIHAKYINNFFFSQKKIAKLLYKLFIIKQDACLRFFFTILNILRFMIPLIKKNNKNMKVKLS